MDIIEKLIAGHHEVKERVDILSKVVKTLDSDAFIWDNVLKISSFFDKEVKEHFKLEEKVLFPIMKKVLPKEKQEILKEIELEHKPILKMLEEFKKIAEKHSNLSSRLIRENFIAISHDIIENLIAHARKEDENLFPLIKIYFSKENYKELEDAYFKYLKV
ncbi:MAG: hypothetical protein A2551_06980 [Elusimicrobia bacterium RIFOXYD2_FULL_34_30]|nr:MAG: hypothetical protein A2551_06980 [Elusimicrobia bacterium RIFOXYD2_FULL_34_30]